MDLDEFFQVNARRLLDDREKRYAAYTTPAEVVALQRQLRQVARDALGPATLALGALTDPPAVLNAGCVKAPGIVIEKFLFEPFAGFRVSALLYRPERDAGRCPALVMPVGHWWAGKSLPMYQQLMRLLARRGVVCVSFDSCGQGESVVGCQPALRDFMRKLAASHPAGQPRPYPLGEAACHGFWAANSVTAAHCLIGDPGYLCGLHQHGLTAVAGKRLIDLLVERPDIDPTRIGLCGASGGGTDSRFLAADDERIALLVPASIEGSDRSSSGGDADQSLFNSVNRGVSPVDLLVCVAPNPLLIISASEDKHDTTKVAGFYRPFWKLLGKEGNIASGIGAGAHGFPHETRKRIAEFVLKHFKGETATVPDAEHADTLEMCSENELQTTLSGNVYLDGIGKSPFDVMAERVAQLERTRPQLAAGALRAAVLARLGETEDSIARPPDAVTGSDGEWHWLAEGGVPLRLVQEGVGPKTVLLLHEEGIEGAKASPVFKSLRAAGVGVLLLDVRGTGVSAPEEAEYNAAFLAPLLMGKQASLARQALHQNRTLPGMRTVDVVQAAQVQAGASGMDIVAEGGMGFVALLAAFLAPEAWRRVFLYRTPVSWSVLTGGRGRVTNFAHYLVGVLEQFDTADLCRSLPRGKALFVNGTDGTGTVLPLSSVHSVPREAAVVRTLSEFGTLVAAPRNI